MVGRKPKSYGMGPMIRVDLPSLQVTAIGPKVGMWLQKIYEEDFSKIKEELLKKGYKKIKAKQVDWTYLPRACPKCEKRDGHPNLQRYNRSRSEHRPSIFRNEQIRFNLYYNHSKPKYHQCFIGYMIGSYWKLSNKINPEKMNPSNWIDKNNIEWFESPKLRKPRKLL